MTDTAIHTESQVTGNNGNPGQNHSSQQKLRRLPPVRSAEELAQGINPQPLSEKDAVKYWAELAMKGFEQKLYTAENGDEVNFQYSPPLEVPREMMVELAKGLELAQEFVREKFRNADETIQFMDKYGPRFAGRALATREICKQFTDLIQKGWNVPIAYDALFTPEGLRVLEVQTGTGYLGFTHATLAASGENPYARSNYFGCVHPEQALREFCAEFDGPVYVVDTDPYCADLQAGDQIHMAQVIGNRYSVPLALKNLVGRNHEGWLFRVERHIAGKATLTQEIVTVKNALCRSTQCDLELFEERLKAQGRADQISLIKDFLTDGSVQWLMHPMMLHILSKHNLNELAEYARSKGHMCAAHFVPIYTPGETVPPGSYASKRDDGNSGYGVFLTDVVDSPYVVPQNMKLSKTSDSEAIFKTGDRLVPGSYDVHYQDEKRVPGEARIQRLVVACEDRSFTVPPRTIFQQRIVPQAIRATLPTQLANGTAEVAATLELRAMAPTFQRDLAASLVYRLAPRYTTENDLTRTNLKHCIAAYISLLSNKSNYLSENPEKRQLLRMRSPFGFGAVKLR